MIVDNVSNVKGFGLFGSYLALENTSLNIDPQLRIANSPENAFATIQAYSSTNPLTKHSLYLLASGEVYVRANNNDRVTLEGGSFYFKTGNLLVNTNIDNGVDKLQVNGTASFSSSVTATSFNGGATLTGTPTAPTATAGTNTTQIATTAFVLANSTASSGTFTPAAVGGITFDRCYWIKNGNVLDVVYNFSITGHTSYSATMTLPNSFTINANSNGREIGGGKITTNSGYSRVQETATSSDIFLSIVSENTGTASGFARASVLIN